MQPFCLYLCLSQKLIQKMKYNFKLIAIPAIVIVALMSSCKKDEREDAQQSASDYAMVEGMFNDLHQQSDNAFDRSVFSPSGDCPTITFERANNSNPDTMLVDFGTGCTDARGITRAGVIRAIYSGAYRQTGTVIIIQPIDFTRNGSAIEGTKTVTNKGPNAEGHIEFEVKIRDAKVTSTEGTVTWESDRVRKWVKGYDTPWPNWTDDVYEISGSGKGNNIKGNDFSVEIKTPLRIELSCRWIVSGTIELTPEGVDARSLNYGDGTCDNKAVLTVRNKDFDVVLR